MSNAEAEVIPAVPRLFEKIKQKLEGIDSKLIRLTIKASLDWYVNQKQNRASSLKTSILYYGTSPIRAKLKRKLFGTRFQHAISGGAKLPVAVNEFFDALGIEIYEGYGLTETVVATNVNRKGKRKIGSVGPCLNGVEVKISEDGEILFRGPNVSPGYFNRPIATQESFGEWFKTGDIGYLDDEGFLFITDRKKDIIVTAGGKKVAPQELENELKGSPPISQAVIVGEGKPYIVALITVDPLAEGNINDRVQTIIENLNKSRASFEQIKAFRIIKEDFSIENGFLTPTMKVKRKLVAEHYKALIDEMYSK
jgi:long-chain acyl-CoA synthetase